MNIKDMVQLAKVAGLDKSQLVLMVYNPILERLGYPVDDQSKMVRGKPVEGNDNIIVDYIYLHNNQPRMIILLEDELEGEKYKGVIGDITGMKGVKFILTISGVEGRLYYRGRLDCKFHEVAHADYSDTPVRLHKGLYPENVFSKEESHWDSIINEDLYREIESDKSVYIDHVIDVLNDCFPNRIDKNNIIHVLEILSGNNSALSKVEDTGQKVYAKFLSEIEYDTDFRFATIKNLLIGEKEYPSMPFYELLEVLVIYMDGFVNEDNIGEIRKAGRYKSTCQMKDKAHELSSSYRYDHVILGDTYIGSTSDGKTIINTVKRLFDILGIDQNTVLIEWVRDNDKGANNTNVVSEGEINKVTLSEISNTKGFISTKIRHLVMFGKEITSPSYKVLTAEIIQRINEMVDSDEIDRVLNGDEMLGLQVESHLSKLNNSNRKNNSRLGNFYIGLNYGVDSLLKGAITLCEAFDINQDEIVIYLD